MTHPGPDPLRDAIAREIVAALVDQLDTLQLPRKNFGTTAWWCAQLDPDKQMPYAKRERLAKDWAYATALLLRAVRAERARRQREREEADLSQPPQLAGPVDLDRLDGQRSMEAAPGQLTDGTDPTYPALRRAREQQQQDQG